MKDDSREDFRLRAVKRLGQLPLRFEANAGQVKGPVQFLSRGTAYTLLLSPTGAVFQLPAVQRPEGNQRRLLRMSLLGSNPAARATGLQELPAKSNYFLGDDPVRWRTQVSNYAKVRFGGVYPKVDLIYYGQQRQLEYDFVIEPGGNPDAISMTLEGADKVFIDGDGDLVAQLGDHELRFRSPVIYQDTPDARRVIPGGYTLRADGVLSFHVDEYDSTKPLVIDPVLTYGTYLGGNSSETVDDVDVDSSGNIYVVGHTGSTNFPMATALQPSNRGKEDIFVIKLNPAGNTLLYATYLGGSGIDAGMAIAVSALGDAYFTGYTESADFPVSPTAFQTEPGVQTDAFVARLNANGSALTFSTRVGGDGIDRAWGIDLDSSGNPYIIGETNSTNFPARNAAQVAPGGSFDAFIAKLNSVGSILLYATYYGGAQSDFGYDIAVDSAGNAYAVGSTESDNFPTLRPIQTAIGGGICTTGRRCPDGFALKLGPEGSPVYSTFLGGADHDQAFAVAVDSFGAAYLTGLTASTDFPTVNPVQAAYGGGSDAFVAKVNPAATALAFSTYLGSAEADFARAIALDSSSNVYVVGTSGSVAATDPLQAPTGPIDILVAKYNSEGSALLFSMTLGGSAEDEPYGATLDASGALYITGRTRSSDFPTPSGLQTTRSQGSCQQDWLLYRDSECTDGFLVKLMVRPGLNANGLVNAASFLQGPLVPGSLAAAFGVDMANVPSSASGFPLPETLGGVSIRINGVAAPLIFSSSSQVNLQVPWELTGQAGATLVASLGGIALSPMAVNMAVAAPGIFTINSQGSGQGAILIANAGDTLAAPPNSVPGRSSRPVAKGEFVTIYCTGLGDVTNRPADGAPASADPLSTTLANPVVTIGGMAATVSYSGLAPGFAGLYQVDAQVPLSAPSGSQVPVQITLEGRSSNTVQMAVE